jgi:4TM region of DNA translocase FtsK/SpoIIIE
MVNPQSSIEENRATALGADQSALIKFFAHLFSYIFHPLFIPVYVTWFIAFVHPAYFSGFNPQQKTWIIIRVAYLMVFFPFITVLISKGLGFSKSIFLKTQRERIIPYILTQIFFFWAYLVFRNQPEIPKILTAFTFGVFLSSSAALLANIRMKISMHAIGMGGLLGIFLMIMFQNTMLMTWPIALVLLVTGLVCTSRMIVSDHTSKEIYAGLFLGLACQFVASVIILS